MADESLSPTPATILIHAPSSGHPSLAEGAFDRPSFMGKWGVAWSTLNMWKGKKDVTITYTPLQSGGDTKFEDLVEYRKESASEGSEPSTVKGTDTLSSGKNAATFDWKGASYLFFVHSHWEVLGYGTEEATGLEWAVTFFSKTLFTPAGLDVYIRASPKGSKPEAKDTKVRSDLLAKIVQAVKQNEDAGVVKLASGGFEVPGIV